MTQNVANSVSIIEAETLIRASLSDAIKRGVIPPNICLAGPPGVAKSAIIHQIAASLTEEFDKPCEVIDIRLAAMEGSDLQGIPYVAETGEVVETYRNGEKITYNKRDMFFSTPSFFPHDPEKNYILFLDELMNAPVAVQHAAYRLILDRTCQNGTKLMDNVAIVAAGNRKEDKTGAKDLAPAAANRFAMHLIIDKNQAKEPFIAYAMRKGFDQSIVGYLNWKEGNIYNPPSNGESAFPTPRSWEFVDGHLKNEVIAANDTLLNVAIAGAVGSSVSIDFMGFREYYSQLPDWKKIRSGKEEYEMPKGDEQLKYAVSSAIAYQVLDAMAMEDKEKSQAEVDNLCKVISQLPRETKIVTFKTMRSFDQALTVKFVHYKPLREQWQTVSTAIKGLN